MREDLAALTPETIAALSNWGLVKRATRELEEGYRPTLQEASDGTVSGHFPDGIVAVLPPGKSLAQGTCNCGASTVCRHRVAVALAYPRGEAASWTPAEVTDEELERFLGKRLLERARAALARGLRATVEGAACHLPTCTVRFLVPRELAMARCDCAATGSCEHVALAVWCFRHGGPVVEFGATRAREVGPQALELIDLLLRQGVVHAGDLEARFEKARRELQGMTWPLVLLESLAEQLRFYRESSSRYRAGEAAFALLSLRARLSGVRELSASYVLGQDTAGETELDHVRLISLGCRLRDGVASLFLADPSGQVLVLEKAARDGNVMVAGDVRLSALAVGQLVSRGVRRRANRSLVLRRERNKHSVVPLGQAWDVLPQGLCDWREESRPTRLLRPLVLAEDFKVLAVSDVEVAYCPGEQQLVGYARLKDGTLLALERTYQAAVPGALDCLARGLSQARRVSGFLRRHGGLVLEPVAFSTGERVVVPDLEPEAPGWELDLVAAEPPADPLGALLARAWGLCEEVVHFGLEQVGSGFQERRLELAENLREHGLSGLGERFGTSWEWYPAAIRTFLASEIQ